MFSHFNRCLQIPRVEKLFDNWLRVERLLTATYMLANFEYSYDLKKLTFVYFDTCLCFLNIFSLPDSKVQFVFHLYMALSFVFLFSYKTYYCFYA